MVSDTQFAPLGLALLSVLAQINFYVRAPKAPGATKPATMTGETFAAEDFGERVERTDLTDLSSFPIARSYRDFVEPIYMKSVHMKEGTSEVTAKQSTQITANSRGERIKTRNNPIDDLFGPLA